jgi:hypothetical protein
VEERIALRLPPDLARQVRDIAEQEKRSVNRQLEVWIEDAVRRWRPGRELPRVAEGEGPPYQPHGES